MINNRLRIFGVLVTMPGLLAGCQHQACFQIRSEKPVGRTVKLLILDLETNQPVMEWQDIHDLMPVEVQLPEGHYVGIVSSHGRWYESDAFTVGPDQTLRIQKFRPGTKEYIHGVRWVLKGATVIFLYVAMGCLGGGLGPTSPPDIMFPL